jgi:uncharacterized protein YdeI (YjbR/CyaY-like superfamily)
MPEAVYFKSPADFRQWLAKHYATSTEILVGYHKKATGKPSMTWTESVDEALCYGWIDGVRRRVDGDRYTIRFTPRKATSIWSAINIKRVEELAAKGRMQPAGLAAFERRREDRSCIYSFEQETIELPKEAELRFRKNPRAWKNFQKMSASYRKTVAWWIICAKQEGTREKRISVLITHSAKGLKVKHLRRPSDRQE